VTRGGRTQHLDELLLGSGVYLAARLARLAECLCKVGHRRRGRANRLCAAALKRTKRRTLVRENVPPEIDVRGNLERSLYEAVWRHLELLDVIDSKVVEAHGGNSNAREKEVSLLLGSLQCLV